MKNLHSAFKVGFYLTLLAVLIRASTPVSVASTVAPADEKLGTVTFAVSCIPAVQADFNRGVALLHDFWYEESKPQFEKILQRDPECSMAHWGIAMSGFHQIWDRPDPATMISGWQQMQAARARPARTPREREYMAALSDFFQPGKADFQTRIDAYAAAMGRLFAAHPEADAGAFYALSLMASEAPTDTSLSLEHKAMAVLVPLWKKYPNHPGLVHYIVHACDTPSLAPSGLAAARHYGEIASSGPHAAHMPGHIFARLGLWQEDIDSQLASIAASEVAGQRGQQGWMDQFHSDDFIAYAYLQSGQEERARAIVADSQKAIAHYEAMPDMGTDHLMMMGMFPYYRVKLPIFVALETRDWRAGQALEPVAGAPPDTQVQISWARMISDGHLRDAARARADLAAYDALLDAVRKGDHAYLADSTGAQIRRGEMLAWLAFASGDADSAVKQMRQSADLQDKVGQGEVDIPAREMLGDILLESNRAGDALREYQQSLKLSPARFNGLFGAGKAAEAAGQPGLAREYYAALLKSTDNGARSTRAEIEHAKAY